MRCWSALLSAAVLGACTLGTTPERARIVAVERSGDALEVTQELQFSPTMLEALDRGIPLRLGYRVHWCDHAGRAPESRVLELRYFPLSRHYELREERGGDRRSFARRSALLAALDRVRLPLSAPPDCGARIAVVLDLTSLPTPLRFPAFLEPSQWRLVSPEYQWNGNGA